MSSRFYTNIKPTLNERGRILVEKQPSSTWISTPQRPRSPRDALNNLFRFSSLINDQGRQTYLNVNLIGLFWWWWRGMRWDETRAGGGLRWNKEGADVGVVYRSLRTARRPPADGCGRDHTTPLSGSLYSHVACCPTGSVCSLHDLVFQTT